MMRAQSRMWRLVPLLASLCIGWLLCNVGSVVHAQAANGAEAGSQCAPANLSAYSADLSVAPDTYDVFARLARPGESAEVSVFAKPLNVPGCAKVGTATATGDTWQHVGTWATPARGSGNIQFTLVSSQTLGLFAANRPQLILVSHANPPCIPTTECYVSLGGHQGVIRPPAGGGSSAVSLRITTVADPSKDSLQSVSYYIDNKPAYAKPRLEPFDMRYVGPGKHTLLRLVYYKSGQQVIVTDTVDRGYADEIVKYVFLSFLYGQKTWLQVVLGLLVFALFWFGVVWIVHVLYRRHLWKVMHFLKYQRRPGNTVAQQPLRSGLTPLHIVRTDELLRLVLRRGIPALFVLASLLVVLSLANNFVAQPYRVDGLSMRDTLEDGNTLLVNRLGPTIAKLGIKPYLPERGEIVVVEHSEELVPGTETKTNIVKRVVALPGERVTVNQDGIRVYNQEHPDGFDPDKAWRETMHVEGTEQPGQYLPYGIDITLGPGELFICGDNRSQSDDSRVFGPILADAVVGKAFVRLYPFSLQ